MKIAVFEAETHEQPAFEELRAEHAFALLLAISHHLPEAMDRARRGPFSPSGLQGFDLAGKTLGVTDTVEDEAFARTAGLRYVTLDELLRQSDVISLYVPSTPATHHLLSAKTFDRMKDGVVVINTARGGLIDPRALVRALRAGKVVGAGLDVLELVNRLQGRMEDAIALWTQVPDRLPTHESLCHLIDLVARENGVVDLSATYRL